MNPNMENKIQKLVSRFFKKAGTEVVTGEIIFAVAYERQFDCFNGEQRKYICLEAVSRIEGEEALEHANELIENDVYYKNRFSINKNEVFVMAMTLEMKSTIDDKIINFKFELIGNEVSTSIDEEDKRHITKEDFLNLMNLLILLHEKKTAFLAVYRWANISFGVTLEDIENNGDKFFELIFKQKEEQKE